MAPRRVVWLQRRAECQTVLPSMGRGHWKMPGISKVTATEAELTLISEDTCKWPTWGPGGAGLLTHVIGQRPGQMLLPH